MRRFRCSAATASTAALLCAVALVSAPGLAPAYADGPITHVEWKTYYGGSAGGDKFGVSVSAAGDVNGDGFDDVVIGADQIHASRPGLFWPSGYATVVSGQDGSILHNLELFEDGDPRFGDQDRFGRSVSGAGDVNLDGYADVIVGSPSDSDNGGGGSATVFSGADGSAIQTLPFSGPGNFFGISVSHVGDMNRDGRPDVAVGSLTNSPGVVQLVRVFSGMDGSLLHTLGADAFDGGVGYAIDAAGDVNNDGYPDLIAGNFFANQRTGQAVVYSGIDGAVLHTWTGGAPDDWFGSVAGAGDVNSDGYDDLIVGAQGVSQNGINSGSATVFSGKDGTILHTFYGNNPGDLFGVSVSTAGDIDQDGYADLIVGAKYENKDAIRVGSMTVFSGRDGRMIYRFFGDSVGDFGSSVSVAGDLNADGVPDLIAGAPFGQGTGYARVFLSTPTAELGDTNADGEIDLLDFDVLAQTFGAATPAGAADADFNSDGVVDLLDFDILAQNFGAPGISLGVVPEPASAGLLALTGPMLIRGRGWRRS